MIEQPHLAEGTFQVCSGVWLGDAMLQEQPKPRNSRNRFSLNEEVDVAKLHNGMEAKRNHNAEQLEPEANK